MLFNDFQIDGLFYTDYLERKRNIPWRLIFIFLAILAFASLIILFFYRLSQKLKFEIANSNLINLELKESRKELLVSNEQLSQLSKFKEDMMNMIVHDLKTPLSSIMNIDLYMDTDNWEAIIKQSGYRMYNLIQNILDVYKYENSEFELNKKSITLVDIINNATDEVQYLADQKELSFDINIDIKCVVYVDVDIIHRVFTNIFSNAIKYSPKSGIISVSVKIDALDQTHVVVSNQGPCIPKEKQEVIFQKFGQAKKESQGEFSSTGLGLAFCKMGIEAHGGEIGVNSEGESGVDFWFSLSGTRCGGCTSCRP